MDEAGRGGMGVVYEAEQISLRRRVALKVLPFAAVLDQRQLQRFQNEAQAAARLHHTNIVPVYSVGCERGVHYYAMQYIEGRDLESVIQEVRPGREGDRIPGRREGADPTRDTGEASSGRRLGMGARYRGRRRRRPAARTRRPTTSPARASRAAADLPPRAARAAWTARREARALVTCRHGTPATRAPSG